MRKVILLMVAVAMAGIMVNSAGAYGGIDHKEARGYFKDPNFAGGKQSCNDCHPFGAGLEIAYGAKEFTVLGHTATTIEDGINLCIQYMAKGNPIPKDSPEMKALIEYIKTFYKPDFLETGN